MGSSGNAEYMGKRKINFYLLHKVSRSGWLWGRRRQKVSTYDSTKRVDGRPIPGWELKLDSIKFFDPNGIDPLLEYKIWLIFLCIIGESRIGQRVLINIAKVFKNISVAYSTPRGRNLVAKSCRITGVLFKGHTAIPLDPLIRSTIAMVKIPYTLPRTRRP